MTPSLPIYVDAVAVDPIQPANAYVAVSNLAGNRYPRYTAPQLAYTRNGGVTWDRFEQAEFYARVTELLPVSGYSAAVYVMTDASRTPQAVGDAPSGAVPALVQKNQPAANGSGMGLAWIAAGLAALALVFALVTDVLTRPEIPLSGSNGFEPRPARRNRWS
jgi:hypothetical protein